MKLEEIEAVGAVVKDGQDYGLIESEVIQGISMLPIGTNLYTTEQIQEYAKAKVLETLEKVKHEVAMNGYIFNIHTDIQSVFKEDQHD